MPKALSPYESAARLDELGWNVLPARYQEKLPAVKWREYEDQRTTDQLATWFRGKQQSNYFILCGDISKLVVIDCDSDPAVGWWKDQLGAELLDDTCCVRTSKGWHYYLSLADADQPAPPSVSINNKDDGVAWDLRSTGTGVIAPPSTHESGRPYRWVRGPSRIRSAPAKLWEIAQQIKQRGSGANTGAGGAGDKGTGRSMLSHLLRHPPAEGNRNSWLTQVLGHYASTHRRMRDLYDVEAERALAMIQPPLPDDEADKTVESVWAAEHNKGAAPGGGDPDLGREELTQDNGYLLVNGREMYTQTLIKLPGDGGSVLSVGQFADFGIRVLGIIQSEDTGDDPSRTPDEQIRLWDVELQPKLRETNARALLDSDTLSDPRALNTWLARYGCGISPPTEHHPNMRPAERLRRWIESRPVNPLTTTRHLGWNRHEQAFIVHDGQIRPGGEQIEPWGKVRPAPHLAQWAPYRYGFEQDRGTALDVLREIMTYHHPEVAAVYGAWWTMTWLKPQVLQRTSLFPLMALEAPSGSGKTSGYFGQMVRLSGNSSGQITATKASLRDYLAAHHSGIVWIDDADDLEPLAELLRNTTSAGTVVKKGADNHRQISAELVAPLVLSGEGLGMHDQRAMLDRIIQITVPNPGDRHSQRPGAPAGRLQWEDIQDLQARYPHGYTAISGWYASTILQHQDRIATDLAQYKPEAGGRHGDKIAIIRLGAQILREILEEGPGAATDHQWVTDHADQWAAAQTRSDENTLTLKILPRALTATGWMNRPLPPDNRWPQTPCLIRGETVLFSPYLLAMWWEATVGPARVRERTETAHALRQQAHALESEGALGKVRVAPLEGGTKTSYWVLEGPLAEAVLKRSRDD